MKPELPANRARFFRTIWRANGVYLFAAGTIAAVCAVGGVAVGVVSLLVSLLRHVPQTPVTNEVLVDRNAKPEKWTLGKTEAVRGTPWRMLPQSDGERQERGGGISSSYENDNSLPRNYLFLNVISLESYYLLPNSKSVILSAEQLEESTATQKPVRWIEYHLIRTDTNKDERLDANDLTDIAFSDASGKQYGIGLTGIESVLGEELVAPDTRLILYRKQGRHFAALLDLKTRGVTRSQTLPTLSSQD